jgi:hypothetical protein
MQKAVLNKKIDLQKALKFFDLLEMLLDGAD